jgi:hypothetical protein
MHPALPDGLPTSLIRALTSADDLASWKAGRYRLRLLSHYRKLEAGVTRDAGEGEARHIVLGVNNTPVNYGGSLHNPVYILSFSEADAPAVRQAIYGSFVATISEVSQFFDSLVDGLSKLALGSREVLGVELLRVRYSRETIIEPEPSPEERWRLMVCQKHPDASGDREWRIAVTLSGPVSGAPEALWVACDPHS